jgi:hypothetical protein
MKINLPINSLRLVKRAEIRWNSACCRVQTKTSQPTSWWFTLRLSSGLRVGLWNSIFSSFFFQAKFYIKFWCTYLKHVFKADVLYSHLLSQAFHIFVKPNCHRGSSLLLLIYVEFFFKSYSVSSQVFTLVRILASYPGVSGSDFSLETNITDWASPWRFSVRPWRRVSTSNWATTTFLHMFSPSLFIDHLPVRFYMCAEHWDSNKVK